jgi:hypothetical protein
MWIPRHLSVHPRWEHDGFSHGKDVQLDAQKETAREIGGTTTRNERRIKNKNNSDSRTTISVSRPDHWR